MQPDRFTALVRENKNLRVQLREANLTIHSLRQEIENLQERLSRYENDESTYNNILPDDSQEDFTDSSNEEEQQTNNLLYSSERLELDQIPVESHTKSVIRNLPSKNQWSSSPRLVFNYEQDGKKIPHILSKNSNKRLKTLEQSPLLTKIKSQNLNTQEQSDIKQQEPILIRGPSDIMQRHTPGKKIYETFFVTGYSFDKKAPVVQYYFPNNSKHFEAILNLIYHENSLRIYDPPSETKSPKFSQRGKLEVKDTFVIPLCSVESDEREFLVACEVEDTFQDLDASLFIFNRVFCFITRCSFFTQLKKILTQLIEKVNKSKSPILKYSPLPSIDCHEFIEEQLTDNLKILYNKNVQKNQFANFGLGDQINIFIDILPSDRQYEYLLQYQQWKVLSMPIAIANEDEPPFQHLQLLGFLLIYLITETKVLLYSASKSKLSEAILETLQIMKPLQYVNPIIMAAIKDDYEEYFGAPMPVLLALWGEAKKKKQKIEIFMNKRSNLQGMIEEGKVKVTDGIIINLDTGYTFGGGLSLEKNKLAVKLNLLVSKQCRTSKQIYRVFSRLLEGNFVLESKYLKDFSEKLVKAIEETQIYNYYVDKLTDMLSK